MSDDLEEILSGEASAEAEQPQETEAVEAAAEDTVEATEPTGEETTEEVADASPASEETKVEDDKLAGITAELTRIRAKNRELEERVNTPAQPEQRPDFFEDPDAALSSVEQRMDQKMARMRIEWSEQAARERHEDFEDKVQVFQEQANENPLLWQQMGQAPDPAEFAYRHADQVAKMREFGDISNFEEKVRADERAKAEKAIAEKYEAKLKELSNLPGSLSDTRAAGGNDTPSVTDEPLEDIMGR